MRRVHNPFFELFPWLIRYSGSVPDMYWNIESDEQRYRYILEWMYATVCDLKRNDDHDIVQDDRIQELFDEFERFMESGFDDYYSYQVVKWIDDHMRYIFDHVVDQVFFGLTSDGRFCAYVPDSWSDIEFDTGYVYGEFDYGRLILRYNADGSGVIDNTGRYDEADINQLKYDVERMKRTLYTLLNQGGA